MQNNGNCGKHHFLDDDRWHLEPKVRPQLMASGTGNIVNYCNIALKSKSQLFKIVLYSN
jgi:hypothetical protein